MSRHYLVLRQRSILSRRDVEVEQGELAKLSALSPEIAQRLANLDWVGIRRACALDALGAVARELDGSLSHGDQKQPFKKAGGNAPQGELLGTLKTGDGLVAVYFHEGTLQLAWQIRQYAYDERRSTAEALAKGLEVPSFVTELGQRIVHAYRVEMAACAIQLHTGHKPVRTTHQDGSVKLSSVPRKLGGRS